MYIIYILLWDGGFHLHPFLFESSLLNNALTLLKKKRYQNVGPEKIHTSLNMPLWDAKLKLPYSAIKPTLNMLLPL